MRRRTGGGRLFYTDCDTEGNFLKEFHADLAQGAATIVPVDDIHHILLVRDPADGVEDDKVSRKVAFKFIMVLFMEVGVVHI